MDRRGFGGLAVFLVFIGMLAVAGIIISFPQPEELKVSCRLEDVPLNTVIPPTDADIISADEGDTIRVPIRRCVGAIEDTEFIEKFDEVSAVFDGRYLVVSLRYHRIVDPEVEMHTFNRAVGDDGLVHHLDRVRSVEVRRGAEVLATTLVTAPFGDPGGPTQPD